MKYIPWTFEVKEVVLNISLRYDKVENLDFVFLDT